MSEFSKDNNKGAEKKRGSQFNILSGDATKGDGGFNAGALSLDNVTPVFIDPAEDAAFIDMGALHARSEPEKRVKFGPDKSNVPDGKLYWLVWVSTEHGENGPYYAGLGACEMLVDKKARRAYKSMPEHVNNLDKAIKGRIAIAHMDEHSRYILQEYLKAFNRNMWDNSTEELYEAFRGAAEQ
ncbi:hypothetical protein CHL76_06555 [Marinococcus halophilus]|uniref:YwhD family protein n=1 Tax=Marinococcus halophilus TaxID=1371 RepID=A0A510Y6E5_MARHA|nr:YwhD family protein [Marinococcus halophilus]OZT80584.1 hypothetical protein CHL76_06555 [Marinococcus halophilus]GEK58940.1 hypothetical protein MHA01_18450 [Marinococcus halophilus]